MSGAVVSAKAGVVRRGSVLQDSWWMAERWMRKFFSSPRDLAFSLLMPVAWLVFFSQALAILTSLPGFRESYGDIDYVAIYLPTTLMMTAVQVGTQSGITMVIDLKSGFMDKLLVSPIRRPAILMGRQMAELIRSFLQALFLLGIAWGLTLLLGWKIPFATGLAGILLIAVLSALLGFAMGGLSNWLGLKTQSIQATMMVSSTITMPMIFLSTSLLPSNFLPRWLQVVSQFNPVSYVADAIRALVLGEYSCATVCERSTSIAWGSVGLAFLVVLTLTVIFNTLALRKFHRLQSK